MNPARGQTTVELALTLPLLVLVLGAVVEIGLVVSDQMRLWHAAREAARVAIVDPDESEIARAAASSGLDHLDIEIEPGAAYRVQGRPLTVELAYHPPGRVPIVELFFDRVRLTARATMRIEKA